MVASIVHFSVVYSNAWVTVVAIILPIVLVISSSLFFKRRQIAIRLRRRKGTMFWFGAVMLALVTSAFILYSYSVVKDYLFPYWPRASRLK